MTASYGVFISAYNAARTIAEAIESVLAQTFAPGSIVVVDDGSTDGTAAIVRSFGSVVKLVAQENLGPGAATDRGFAEVTEPLVAGLDADDVWFPAKAAVQIAALDADPRLDAVFCHAVYFDHGDAPTWDSPSRELLTRSALMMRRSALARAGAVRVAKPRASGEMVDWLARGREAGLQFGAVPAALVGRRRISGSLTDGQDAGALLPIVRAALERRRGG